MRYLDENEDYLLTKDSPDEFTQSDDDAIDLADGVWPACAMPSDSDPSR